MPEPHQRWSWHPALYITALKLSNKQHHLHLFARSQFFQQNTSIMHHPTSSDCHQSSLLVVGCNCCKHASSLDNHSCRRLTAQLLKRREGDVWPKGMLPGTCFSKAFASVILCRDIYLHAFVLSELAQAVTLHVGAQRVLGIFPAAQSFLHRAIGHGLMQDWKVFSCLAVSYPENSYGDGLIPRERVREPKHGTHWYVICCNWQAHIERNCTKNKKMLKVPAIAITVSFWHAWVKIFTISQSVVSPCLLHTFH